ncbi:sensor histidine kinase [Brevibacterium sediminis]|uniref:sensor histidine kinase n=1 Tax=Brevibacterium sediminis TaxID=1857024 RepID=UPI0021753FE5|nr:histidine kinase [Brevibacterium sediminis]MCS4592337.1 sensor histidine kinase [Brevibacterium sediminis]
MGSADVSETGEERERLEPWLTDASLAVAVTLVISLVIAADAESSPLPGVAWAIGFGALMLLRRRLPLTVLAVTVFGIFAYYALNLPPIGMVLPAVGALYSTAEVRRTSWAVLGAAVLIAVSTFYRFDDLDPRAQLTGYGFVTELALAAAAIALGSVVRLVRETRTQSARIAALTTAEESRAAEARMHSERVRIARDLHDTIGHTLSVASLHTSVAAEAVDPDDRGAALERVRGATSEALRELRRTVKVLREESAGATDPGPASALGLASISSVIESARAAGLDVTVDLDVDPARLPRAVDAAAFRIVQESVTNVLRHSGASAARISGQVHGDELIMRIRDDGHGGAADTVAGAGIRGMSERAGLLGGRLGAGANGEGFEVIAHLPINVEENE